MEYPVLYKIINYITLAVFIIAVSALIMWAKTESGKSAGQNKYEFTLKVSWVLFAVWMALCLFLNLLWYYEGSGQ